MIEKNLNFENLILHLISSKKEGDYWDFKQEWHDKQEDLIKDIICFCNTIHNKDCYLIFGVSDNYEITGMHKQRRKQANILDILSKVKFSDVEHPVVEIRKIKFTEKEIDVLVIKNINKTPIYLVENYGKLKRGIIYSRNKDRNTPIDSNSDVMTIENLWKKRFGILKCGYEFYRENLDYYDRWQENEVGYYHKFMPEYKIEINYDELLEEHAPLYFSYVMTNESTQTYSLKFYQNSTEIKTFDLLSLDGGRLIIPYPMGSTIINSSSQEKIYYKYYINNSILDKLRKFLFFKTENPDKYYSIIDLKKVILFFDSDEERLNFEEYVTDRIDIFEIKVEKIDHLEHIIVGSSERINNYKLLLKQGLILSDLLQEYRKVKG